MVLGLTQFSQRTGEGGGEPVLDTFNGEELVHVQSDVAVVIGNRAPESPGTLYISTKKVVWLSDVDKEKGYAVDFLSLSLHAVSRDPETYPSPCIYTQIGIEADDDLDAEDSDSDSERNENVDLSHVREMRLIPSDPSQLDTLFQIFCECAELNPEPVNEADQEEHNWIFSADQMADDDDAEEEDSGWDISQNPTNSIGHSNGDHDVTRRVLELQIDDRRFEDPEEMEHERSGHHQ